MRGGFCSNYRCLRCRFISVTWWVQCKRLEKDKPLGFLFKNSSGDFTRAKHSLVNSLSRGATKSRTPTCNQVPAYLCLSIKHKRLKVIKCNQSEAIIRFVMSQVFTKYPTFQNTNRKLSQHIQNSWSDVKISSIYRFCSVKWICHTFRSWFVNLICWNRKLTLIQI